MQGIKLSKVSTIAVLLFSLSAHGASPDELTRLSFETALQLTLQNNFLIQQSNHMLLQSEQEIKTAGALRYPKITLSAGYTIMEDRIHFDLTPVRDAISPIYQTLGSYGVFSGVPNPNPATGGSMPILPDNLSTQVVRKKMMEGMSTVMSADWDLTIQERQFATLNAAFVWPIFTGGKINAANSIARIKYETVKTENIQKAYELTNELIERYFGLVFAEQVMVVRDEAKKIMELHYHDAEKLRGQGQIANVELLNSRLNLAESEREMQKSVRQCSLLREALLNTMADKQLSKIQPITSLFYLDSLERVNYFIEKAMQKSPFLLQINKKKELANAALRAEKSEKLPTIAATGMYDIANRDLSPYLPGYVVGLGMKWNLFEGSARNCKTKALHYQQLQAEDFYQKTFADIQTAISKHYQELNMYREQLQMLDASMELAREYYRVRNKAFGEGMATSAQVADASLLLAKARMDRLQAMYGYDVSLSKLLFYAGITDEFTDYLRRASTKID